MYISIVDGVCVTNFPRRRFFFSTESTSYQPGRLQIDLQPGRREREWREGERTARDTRASVITMIERRLLIVVGSTTEGGREAEAERKREAEIKRKKQEDKFQISSINWRIAGATSTANTNTDTCTHGVLRNANGHGGDFNPAWARANSFERAFGEETMIRR